jgi:S1-C subfamily serine protease
MGNVRYLKLSVITLVIITIIVSWQLYLDRKMVMVDELIKDAAVKILLCGTKSCSQGSGFVIKQIDKGAYIITNKHVCNVSAINSDGVYNYKPVEIVRRDGRSGIGQILRVAPNSDLCLIFIRMKFTKTLDLASSYRVGQSIRAYGFPAGVPALVQGVIKNVYFNYFGIYVESDMHAWYGISGSAVVDEDGQVVGVLSNLIAKDSKDRSTVTGSLFVPLEILKDFLGGI